MPVSLPSPTRRKFLTTFGAAFVSLPFTRGNAAEVDEDLIALLNDTHIGEKQPSDSPIPRNLMTAVDWLLAQPKRPACVLINGDLALKDGQPGDYRFLAKLIQPLRDAGLPVHLTMGNHDAREVFYEVLSAEKPQQPVVAAKHITVVPARRANLFLLDSLQIVNKAPGELGQEQLTWLARALDAHADKPAVVVAHHNPRLGGDPLHFPGGLIDSRPLWELLAPRRHVKAYVHGHIHFRSLAKHGDIHIVNTPATSYVGNAQTSTTGWTMARLRDDGMDLTTHTHLAEHAWNKQEDALGWRA
jgi:Icc protein